MKFGIVGAGIGGLTAAIALRQAGHDAEIFEQADAIEPMGAALSIWPNAISALDEIGLGDQLRAIAQPINHVAIADWQGRDLTRFQVDHITPGQTAYLPTRSQLQHLLKENLAATPLNLGQELDHIVEDEDGVTLHFDTGLNYRCDILIAADGIWSDIAKNMTKVTPKYAGYGGFLALTDPVAAHPTSMSGTEYWGVRERIGVFDLKDDRKYWFYMKTGLRQDDLSKITVSGLADRLSDWPPEIAAALAATDQQNLIPFIVHAKPKPKLMAKNRVILLGDAAHAMEPNMGQGGCQAIEDAVVLGRISRNATEHELAEFYQAARLKRVGKFTSLSNQGSIAPHQLPAPLVRPVHAAMRIVFPAFANRQMKNLYTF